MFIFLTILLFLLSSLAMLILHLVRPRLSIQGFLAVITVISGLVMVLIARSEIPSSSNIFSWAPASLLPLSPFLLIDDISWTLSLVLAALAATLIIISIAQMGRNPSQNNIVANNNNQAGEAAIKLPIQSTQKPENEAISKSIDHWLFWVAVLVCASLGLVAVTAGNLLTLLLAWAALDMVELAILIGHSLESVNRERAAIIFSAKLAGMLLLLIAGLVNWSQIGSLDFSALSSAATILLASAAALRLGVLPPFFPFAYRFQSRQELATLTYLHLEQQVSSHPTCLL
jgi:formate hydrogenlyase subunit 3/multisubunit Na+/H+ antiporter MnhD subunit